MTRGLCQVYGEHNSSSRVGMKLEAWRVDDMRSSDLQGVGLTGMPADDPLAYSKVLLYYVIRFNLLVGQRRCKYFCMRNSDAKSDERRLISPRVTFPRDKGFAFRPQVLQSLQCVIDAIMYLHSLSTGAMKLSKYDLTWDAKFRQFVHLLPPACFWVEPCFLWSQLRIYFSKKRVRALTLPIERWCILVINNGTLAFELQSILRNNFLRLGAEYSMDR